MTKTPEEIQSEKLFKKICRKVGTTLRDHRMVQEGDHVLVGLSGGKDSMILLQSLEERRQAVPFDFKISAAHVTSEGVGYQINLEKLNSISRALKIPLYHRTIVPDLEKNPSKNVCFVCSWHRRKELFALTKELNCNKLALGHHRDDAVETLLLNMIYHGSISSLPYSLSMFEGRIHLIRPLMDLDETLLNEYANLNDLVKVEKSCPHENSTQRAKIANLIREIEQFHGAGPYNLFKSMTRIYEEYLPVK